MNKNGGKENLKSFSIIYLIVSAFYVIGAIICNFMPELSKPVAEAFAQNGLDGMLVFNISAGIVVILNIWYFWLCRRVADGKSQGTLYMILLLLGAIGSIVSFFTTPGATKALSFDAVVDICGLYFLFQAKKED